MARPQNSRGYSILSIISHWLTAILVIALFISHEGGAGSTTLMLHVSGGAFVGIFLLWQVWHRIRAGMTEASDQAWIFNLASKSVMWGFLVSIAVVTVTGYLVPWAGGEALEIFNTLSVPSPIAGSDELRYVIEKIHYASGHFLPYLIVLHVLGAAKHLVIDRDGVFTRMIRPAAGGR